MVNSPPSVRGRSSFFVLSQAEHRPLRLGFKRHQLRLGFKLQRLANQVLRVAADGGAAAM